MSIKIEHVIIDGNVSKQCSKCSQFKNVEEFPKDNQRWDKLSTRCKKCENERRRTYYHNNIEHEKEREKKKPISNHRKHYLKTHFKKYRELNKEQFNLYVQKRRALKKQLLSTLTLEEWDNIKMSFENQCAYCGEEVKLEQEHFIPLSKGGEYTHNNIIPSCKSCNCSKRDKDFFEWYSTREFYDKKREKVILKHLGYKNNVQQLSIL